MVSAVLTAVHIAAGDNRIICFLMIAGLDAGAQSQGLRITRHERRDRHGVRTVGVLTKVDVPGDRPMRENIMSTQTAFPLTHGYFAVRLLPSLPTVLDFSESQIRESDGNVLNCSSCKQMCANHPKQYLLVDVQAS